jgi:hypothetical protein
MQNKIDLKYWFLYIFSSWTSISQSLLDKVQYKSKNSFDKNRLLLKNDFLFWDLLNSTAAVFEGKFI